MLNLINRGKYSSVIQGEFEHLSGRLRTLLSQVLDSDGNLIVEDPNLAVVPVGAVQTYAGATAPSGWLLCDGAQVSRLTYKALFDIIGTAYGVGDGSTTFNIPDARGRFALGKAASGTGSTLAGTGGAIDHTHTAGAHTHSISTGGAHSHTVSGHTHSVSIETDVGDNVTVAVVAAAGVDASEESHTHTVSGNTDSASPSTDSQGSHDHGGVTGSSSGSTGTANPPYIVFNTIIFAGV